MEVQLYPLIEIILTSRNLTDDALLLTYHTIGGGYWLCNLRRERGREYVLMIKIQTIISDMPIVRL